MVISGANLRSMHFKKTRLSDSDVKCERARTSVLLTAVENVFEMRAVQYLKQRDVVIFFAIKCDDEQRVFVNVVFIARQVGRIHHRRAQPLDLLGGVVAVNVKRLSASRGVASRKLILTAASLSLARHLIRFGAGMEVDPLEGVVADARAGIFRCLDISVSHRRQVADPVA